MPKSLLLLAAAAVAAAALALPAWSAPTPPPQLTSFSVGAVRASHGGLKLAVSGSIDCSAKAHFHIWLWVYQASRGALAHAYYPGSGSTKKKRAALLRKSTCSGAARRWTLKGKAEGKHPATFVAGAAQVCTDVTVSHSRKYVLQSSCAAVTIP